MDTWRLVAATIRVKLVFCLVDLKACVPKLCVLLYSVVLSCVAACLVCVNCSKLRFVNKGLLLLLLLLGRFIGRHALHRQTIVQHTVLSVEHKIVIFDIGLISSR